MTQADRESDEARTDLRQVLLDESEVGRHLATIDWSATPLGPADTWPQSLRTAVRIMLGSRFSMWMAWGPDLTFFCNDAYRRDTLGKKFPWALGRPASVVWSEIWPEIGPRIEGVLSTGIATWDEALQLFLERSGYVEDSYHTFSYSPIADDDGRVAGMFCVVSEETERIVAERRMKILRDLGSQPDAVRSEQDVIDAAAGHLAHDQWTLPFSLTYLFDDDRTTARLAAASGVPLAEAPAIVRRGGDALWPVEAVLAGQPSAVGDLAARFAHVPTGAWPEPPDQGYVVPLMQPGQAIAIGFLVVGVNKYRPFDDEFRAFAHLIAGHISAGIANARAYEAERRRAESLAELDEAKTAFFTNVSHEFRTPLTLMLGPAEDALADTGAALPARQRERVELIQRNARRLLKLVNTLLDFSRLASGNVDARFEPIDLSSYTTDLSSMFRAATDRAGLRLDVDVTDLGERVYIDTEMWAKIVLNLLSNALKFTFSGGISVRLRRDGDGDGDDDGVRLTVADTGIGIDPADQAHLFERFRRVQGVRARTHEGSGIGLALVAELTALHGGEVTVASTPGVGSEFTVRIPLGSRHLPPAQIVAAPTPAGTNPPAEEQARGFMAEAMRWLVDPAQVDATGASTPGLTAAEADRHRPHVLVADDNEDMRHYIATLLNPDYEVTTAIDGMDALAKALADPPDLVLTDVMMPNIDGFGLLAALRAQPSTMGVPVVMLSARAGEDGTVEGLEAGASDYLSKPFSARELLARVKANLELDRARRTRDELQRSQLLLDQAQRLALVGNWEIDLATQAIHGSHEYFRLLGVDPEEFATGGVPAALRYLHADDAERLLEALDATVAGENALDLEFRIVPGDGGERRVRSRAELVRDDDGTPRFVRGTLQDITDQYVAQEAIKSAAAAEEAGRREHHIAAELQRSLLPQSSVSTDHLDIATFYRAGVEGTQVGGDWYDVIELGAGRTALVMGDVMGRGVRAAAVMGQLRAAVRAYARLDLPPADVLEFLDGVVRDLGEDQIVTCVYGVYDPTDNTFVFANAGHLPPLLSSATGVTRRLDSTAGAPLGTGPLSLSEAVIDVPAGALVAMYTDGLVERRDSDLDAGIDRLASGLAAYRGELNELPDSLVAELLPDGPDDDVAVLIARVTESLEEFRSAVRRIGPDEREVRATRGFVTATMNEWGIAPHLVDDIVLLVSELVTNAVIHGSAPIELRLRRSRRHVVLEVYDGAFFLPRKLRPTPDDEHGRGLQLVTILADRWGIRPTAEGKSVWCMFELDRDETVHEYDWDLVGA